ncbi:hypothetical protein D9M72_593050 [compost metagenome]
MQADDGGLDFTQVLVLEAQLRGLVTAQRVAETGNKALIWEGHKAGRDIGYCHLEKLHNLEALPAHGSTPCR